MGFVIWKRKAKGGGRVRGFVFCFSYGGLWLVERWWGFRFAEVVGAGEGGFGWIVLVVYCIEYIILLCYLYYFNVLNAKIKSLILDVL